MIDRLDQSNESLHIPEVLLWLVNIYVKIIDTGLWSNQETDTDAQSCELNSHPDFFCCFFFNKNATSEFSNQILFWVGVFSNVRRVRKLAVRACVCRLWRCSKSDWLISNTEIEFHSQIVSLSRLHLCEDIDIVFWSNQEIDIDTHSCELKSHPGFFIFWSVVASCTHKWKNRTKKCSM